jgi:signal transduction histidine kinase
LRVSDTATELEIELEETGTEDLYRSERTMIIARWIAVPWVFLQILAYEVPYPPGYKARALALAFLLIVGNGVLWWFHRGAHGKELARPIAVAGLALDIALLSAFVWLYAFDYDTQIWPVLFIALLEGAILFQLRGAVLSWVAITTVYAAREMWAEDRFGNPFLWNSITFRMGVGGIIALVAGMMARDLHRQRAQLSFALHEIRRIDRMRAGLVSMLGHDVRGPLTVIRGAIATLITGDDRIGTADRIDLLKSTDRQARRLERLATDLLDLARLDEGRLQLEIEQIDVEEVVNEALSYVESPELLTVAVEDGLRAKADPQRLEQVLVNLVGNALVHGAPPISVTGSSRNGVVLLEVSDHGAGVDPSVVDRLFEPFVQEEKKEGSAGYGLAIVKALVQAQGGDVSYEPNEHGGASFQVELPKA